HGNVSEWCRDSYRERLPGGTDPVVGDRTSDRRVVRGASYYDTAAPNRSAFRTHDSEDDRIVNMGFRVALEAQKSPEGKAAKETLPPALTEYKGRAIAPYMSYLGADWLIRESREREEACEKLLKILEVKPGAVLCDMGCGNGYYSIKLAKLVGEKGR